MAADEPDEPIGFLSAEPVGGDLHIWELAVRLEHQGHGIGRAFHEEPQVPHHGRPNRGSKLRPGMVFTIEPMINEGTRHTRLLPDGWTVVTKDRSLSAQWEHTLLVTETGCEVLTLSEGTPARPGRE